MSRRRERQSLPPFAASRIAGFALVLLYLLLVSTSCSDEPEISSREPCECGVPPPCGQPCRAKCGCCGVGGDSCVPEGIRRVSVSANCYDVVACSASGRCVYGPRGPTCAESLSDCEAVRAAYQDSLRSPSTVVVRSGDEALPSGIYPQVQCAQGCQVLPGHCAQGLDTCWLLTYGVDSERDRLAHLYQELGCPPVTTCSCPSAPVAACRPDASGAAGSYSGPLTCTVE